MPVNRGLFTSANQEWETPQEFFDYLDLQFHFNLDPCASDTNHKCDKYYTIETDGLSHSWAEERVYMNPPYGRDIGKWVKKAYLSAQDQGALVVCLLPARTDTIWWHQWVMRASEIRFIRGRLKFLDENQEEMGSAPFPSCVVVFRPWTQGHLEVFTMLSRPVGRA